MRVIAGTARGIRLYAPKGMQTRPTSDRVKEALFSIIVSKWGIYNATVLDICAGTGSLGIEALSRGAGSCCFIEQSRSVMSVLEKNLATSGFTEKSCLLAMDAVACTGSAVKKYGSFDIIFFDPPYASNLYATVIPELEVSGALNTGGVLVVECSSQQETVINSKALDKVDRRVYGDTAIEFYTREQL